MTSGAKTAFANDLTILFNQLDLLAEREETPGNKAKRDRILDKINIYRRALYLVGYAFNTEYRDGFEVVEIIKL